MKKFLIIALMFLFVHVVIFGQTVEIVFLNDFHGMLREQKTSSSYNPGIAKFMSVLEDEIKKNPDSTIVISGGDNYQGDFLSSMAYGAPVNDMFKILHLRASAVGNHEFDWSKDFSKQNPKLSKADFFKKWEFDGGFTFLAANIIEKSTKIPVTWAKPYEIITVNDVKIAFIGLSTKDTPMVTSADNVSELEFTDAAQSAQKWIDYLEAGKDPSGVPDVIIALTHIPYIEGEIKGDELINLCKNTKGLDLVLSSHSHEVVSREINGIPVIQAGCFGRGVAFVNLDFDPKTGEIDIAPKMIKITSDMAITPSQDGLQIIEYYMNMFRKYTKVIGFANDEFTREGDRFSSMGRFTVESLQKVANTQIVLTNNGGMRSDLSPGNIMIGDVYSVFPFTNTVVTMELKGSALMEALKNPQAVSCGLIPKIKYTGDEYEVIGAIMPDGGKIDEDKYYTVSINDYMLTGGNNYKFPQYRSDGRAREVYETEKTYVDIISNEIEQQKNITPRKGEYIIEENFKIKANQDAEQQVKEDAA